MGKQISIKNNHEYLNLTTEEDVENTLVTELNKADEKLPTIEQNRKIYRKGKRLDRFMVSEDLLACNLKIN